MCEQQRLTQVSTNLSWRSSTHRHKHMCTRYHLQLIILLARAAGKPDRSTSIFMGYLRELPRNLSWYTHLRLMHTASDQVTTRRVRTLHPTHTAGRGGQQCVYTLYVHTHMLSVPIMWFWKSIRAHIVARKLIQITGDIWRLILNGPSRIAATSWEVNYGNLYNKYTI